MHVPGARNDARTGVGADVCGRPRRIWPGTRPIGANARNGVGAYRIRPPKRARGPEWMDAGYDHSPHTGSFGGAYAIRPYPAGRRAFGYPANFAGVPDAPRGLGKCQTSCFKVSEASERLKQVVSRFPTRRKGSNKLFQGIRGVGKLQNTPLNVSEASESSKTRR